MSTKKVFHWSFINPKLLTPEGRIRSEDSVYADVAWDVLAEAAKRHHLQDIHGDAWQHFQTTRNIRDNGPGGIDGEIQFAFFFVLTAMVKVQLKVQERDGIPENLRGNNRPGGMSKLSEGESTEFVMIDVEELQAVMPKGVRNGTSKGVLNKVAGWVFGKAKK